MFCQQCGAQIEDGLAFCTTCGAKQITTPAPANNFVENSPVQPTFNTQVNQTNNQFTQQEYVPQQNNVQPNVYVASTSGSPKKVSFGEAIKLFFVNYVNFKGRSTASEYWWAFLFNALIGTCTSWIPVVGTIVALGLLLPGLSIGIRRLHDTGKSWTYIFMGLIPIAGAIILIIQFCKESDFDNKWGPAARN